MHAGWVACSWAIAVTMALMVGCGHEGVEREQTHEPVQLSSSEQEITGGHPVPFPSVYTTSAAPAIVYLDNETYVFFRSSTDSSIYMLRTAGSIGDQQWGELTRLPGFVNTSGAPSVVTLNNIIYVVYKGAWSDTYIYIARSMDKGTSWAMARFPDNVNTRNDPTAFVSGNSLYVFYAGVTSYFHQTPIFMAQLSDNTTWTGGGVSPNADIALSSEILTSAAPALVSLGSETYLFYKDGHGIFMRRASGPVGNRQWQGAIRLPGAVNTGAAPSVVMRNGTIYVVYKGIFLPRDLIRNEYNDTRIYVVRSTDGGSTWSMARVHEAGYSGASFPDTVNTTNSPRAHMSGDSLYVLYRGAYEDSRMYMARLSDNTVWEPLPY